MVARKQRSASLSLTPALAAMWETVSASGKCSWMYCSICLALRVSLNAFSEGGKASAGLWEKRRKSRRDREERT